ncbi:MAG TPA: hypothetical protein VGL48_09115 [Acidimicrobiales bacterium]
MRFSRAKFGIGVVTIGAVMAMAPSSPSWGAVKAATTTTTTSSSSSSTTKGSNPNAPLCRIEKSGVAAETKSSQSAEAALASGNWNKAKKALLAEVTLGTKFERQAVAALAKAPAKVKAATTVVIKFAAFEKTTLQKSKSESAFEKTDEKAASAKSLQKAEQTLSSYQTSLCGSVTTTS